jgi:hypothetical protein
LSSHPHPAAAGRNPTVCYSSRVWNRILTHYHYHDSIIPELLQFQSQPRLQNKPLYPAVSSCIIAAIVDITELKALLRFHSHFHTLLLSVGILPCATAAGEESDLQVTTDGLSAPPFALPTPLYINTDNKILPTKQCLLPRSLPSKMMAL